MVRVEILDSSAVTVAGTVISGPASFDADLVTVGAASWGNGVILVQSGAGVQTMTLHPLLQSHIPLGMVAIFCFGLVWSWCCRK